MSSLHPAKTGRPAACSRDPRASRGMSSFWRNCYHIVACLVGLFIYAHVQTLHAQNLTYFRDFWTPMYRGLPLNYCLTDGMVCGMPVADHYCRWLGFKRAVHILEAHNLRHTRYFSTRQRCNHWQCNGFKNIRCEGRLNHQPLPTYYYRKKRFYFPRYMGLRVDWCAKGDRRACGKKAAYSFCRRIGYMKTIGFAPMHVGSTSAIENQKVCVGCCTGFRYIDCYR